MRYRNQRGSVLLLLVITIPFLFALSAIAVDIGALYLQRAHMQNIADAAALAGASQLGTGQTEAQAMAERYITLNGRTGDATQTQTIQFPSTGQIRVKLERPFPFLFMRYFDFLALDLTVSAVAVAEAYTDSGGGIADYAFVQRGSAPLTLDGGRILQDVIGYFSLGGSKILHSFFKYLQNSCFHPGSSRIHNFPTYYSKKPRLHLHCW